MPGEKTAKLRRPLRRKLDATTRDRRHLPWFIEINPQGVISVWPRRCKHEEMHIETLYILANRSRKAAEREARRKAKVRR